MIVLVIMSNSIVSMANGLYIDDERIYSGSGTKKGIDNNTETLKEIFETKFTYLSDKNLKKK